MENPSAFPSQHRGSDEGLMEPANGMDLRDWFAGQALIGFMTILSNAEGVRTHDGNPMDENAIAKQAFAFADAMLAARQGPST